MNNLTYRSAFILNKFGFAMDLTEAITQSEAVLLLMIDEYCVNNSEKQGIKTTQLSVESGTSKPLVSKLLNNLTDKNLINRIHSKEDRRVIYITLSQEGKDLRDSIFIELEKSIVHAQACIGKEKYLEFLELATALFDCNATSKNNIA